VDSSGDKDNLLMQIPSARKVPSATSPFLRKNQLSDFFENANRNGKSI
jgi:hypothetical protein